MNQERGDGARPQKKAGEPGAAKQKKDKVGGEGKQRQRKLKGREEKESKSPTCRAIFRTMMNPMAERQNGGSEKVWGELETQPT